jgi:hypothetical protein
MILDSWNIYKFDRFINERIYGGTNLELNGFEYNGKKKNNFDNANDL